MDKCKACGEVIPESFPFGRLCPRCFKVETKGKIKALEEVLGVVRSSKASDNASMIMFYLEDIKKFYERDLRQINEWRRKHKK